MFFVVSIDGKNAPISAAELVKLGEQKKSIQLIQTYLQWWQISSTHFSCTYVQIIGIHKPLKLQKRPESGLH